MPARTASRTPSRSHGADVQSSTLPRGPRRRSVHRSRGDGCRLCLPRADSPRRGESPARRSRVIEHRVARGRLGRAARPPQRSSARRLAGGRRCSPGGKLDPGRGRRPGHPHGLPPVWNGDRRVRVRSLRTAPPQATLENGLHRGGGSDRRAGPRGLRAEPRQRRHAPGKDRASAAELVAGPPEVDGRPSRGDPVDRPSSLTAAQGSRYGAVRHTAAAGLVHRRWSGIAAAAG